MLSDTLIRKWCTNDLYHHGKPLLTPFSEPASGDGIISYGLTSAGYDVRLAPEILMFKNSSGQVVDPRRFGDSVYRATMFDRIVAEPGPLVIPAGGYLLGMSYEYVRIPRNLKGRCVGKSTLARCGILVNTTPMEPEWEGYLTIEIGNINPCPAMVFVMQGIAQFEFELIVGDVEQSYADKRGQYQNQTSVTPARVKGVKS